MPEADLSKTECDGRTVPDALGSSLGREPWSAGEDEVVEAVPAGPCGRHRGTTRRRLVRPPGRRAAGSSLGSTVEVEDRSTHRRCGSSIQENT